jgi:hypothetical protein
MSNRLRKSSITVVGFGFAFLGIAACAKKEQAGTDTLAATNTAPKMGGDTTNALATKPSASSTLRHPLTASTTPR